MKHFLLRTFKFLLAVLFPGLLWAQGSSGYVLKLNSGNYLPQENSKNITKEAALFRNSIYQDKYYVLLQFYALPNQEAKETLQKAGVQLIDYIPNLAYTAVVKQNTDIQILRNFNIRSVYQLTSVQKTAPALLSANFPAYAVKQPGFIDVTVITYEKLSAKTVGSAMKKVSATILEDMPMFRSFTVRIPQAKIEKLIELPFIQWVEPIDAPNVSDNLLGRTLHRVNVLNDGVRNLKGDSINVGIWDEGEVSPHLDFMPITSRLNQMETSAVSSHTTHVAGTIGGRGLINPKARGMAPNAKIYSYNFSGNIQTEMAAAIPAYDLAVSSHSYGSTQTCGVTGAGVAYSSTSRSTDINLNTYPNHLHVHSAGNSQTACAGGWSTITGSGKSAKNNILVANITSTEAMSSSSSFGPVSDGRVKPEISSFGTNVLSTYIPLNTYGTISGTSMATPGVSGTVALLVQRYKQLNGNIAPISALIKGVLCNTAQDLGNPGPDYKFGFGRLNALEAVRALEQNHYVVNSLATGNTNDVTITVPAGAARLKVMLTWNDPAGATNANPALVNNLDLQVISAGTTTLPWILDPNSPAGNATRGVDNVSNIEQTTLDNPAPGTYTLRVNGTAIPTGPNQQYALTWEIDQPYLEVIYPNGNESFSPGDQETITWNNAGITGNQTVQYSLDNGATWVTISATIPATTTRYTWTVPTGANTATALVKVFSGSLTDVSNANFKILGTPAALNTSAGLCSGTLNFVWPAVTNATHYDLYKLDNASGQWVTLATNITGTTYTATGLTPNADMWFTLSAKNNLTGAISEKALAINRTIPATGNIVLNPISGLTNICSTSQNVTYSVQATSNVSTYNWSVPPGASIASGQGTNTITVNFSGNLTGNISVTGTAGSCQTPPETLAISVTSNIAAPVSGGDENACIVTGNTKNTLIPTATVPAGYSVVWYSAPTGGFAVTNPELKLAGTVTYYAASRSLNGSCESSTRTPVTLTLNSPLPATITSSGSTTICEGNSVILTASPGTAYLWNNGETTRSVIGHLSGGYQVTIWQANGCEGGAMEVITVVPKPTLKLVAEPTTNLNPTQKTTLKATGDFDAKTTFIWKKNGIVIPGGAKSTLEVSVPATGDYTVDIKTTTGCEVTSNIIALTDEASDGMFIYPNPSNGHFQVQYYTKPGVITNNTIVVYDSRGALVRLQPNSVKQTYERIDVDMSKQSKGVYFIMLKDADGKKVASGRVVIH